MKKTILLIMIIAFLAGCKTIDNPGFYKDNQSRQEYLSIYESILEDWPVPYNEIYVETSSSITFVLNWGSEENPPLVLLHPNLCSSVDFKFLAETLSEKYNVFAIDVIGEPGRTEITSRPRERSEYMDWLNEVLDELQLDKFHLMGYSMGSAISTYYAVENPNAVEQLTLIAPVLSIVSPPGRMTGNLTLFYFFKSRENWADSTIRIQSTDFEELQISDVDFYNKFKACFYLFDPNTPNFSPLSLDELSRISTPLSIIIGDSDVWVSMEELFQRLDEAGVVYSEYIIEDGNHLFSMDQKIEINNIIGSDSF